MAEDIVAVDVGGTFTDICVLRRDTGELRVAKVPSTANPIDGVMSGVETGGNRSVAGRPLLAWHDGGHERADHAHLPRGRDGHHEGLP